MIASSLPSWFAEHLLSWCNRTHQPTALLPSAFRLIKLIKQLDLVFKSPHENKKSLSALRRPGRAVTYDGARWIGTSQNKRTRIPGQITVILVITTVKCNLSYVIKIMAVKPCRHFPFPRHSPRNAIGHFLHRSRGWFWPMFNTESRPQSPSEKLPSQRNSGKWYFWLWSLLGCLVSLLLHTLIALS
jgi:hypothetical protein